MDQSPYYNPRLGLMLALASIGFWGLLPVVSKGLLDTVDPYTLNFYRFVVAVVFLSCYIRIKGQKAIMQPLQPKHYALLVTGVGGLLANHVMFMDALKYIPAGASQIIIQLGPIALLIVSVAFLKESFSLRQWSGTLIFVLGLVLFFQQRLYEIFAMRSDYAFGIYYMIAAALIWIFYGIAQKLLIGVISPVFILLCCYGLGVVVLFPFADLGVLLRLDGVQLWLLTACCFTSLFAYICFGESLVRLEASKGSALLAFIPLAAICYENLFAWLLPGYISAETLVFTSLLGAMLVVLGCVMVAISNRRKAE